MERIVMYPHSFTRKVVTNEFRFKPGMFGKIIIEQKIKPSPKVEKEKASFRRFPKQKDSITVEVDSIKR